MPHEELQHIDCRPSKIQEPDPIFDWLPSHLKVKIALDVSSQLIILDLQVSVHLQPLGFGPSRVLHPRNSPWRHLLWIETQLHAALFSGVQNFNSLALECRWVARPELLPCNSLPGPPKSVWAGNCHPVEVGWLTCRLSTQPPSCVASGQKYRLLVKVSRHSLYPDLAEKAQESEHS